MASLLSRFVRPRDRHVIVECRRCGTSVDRSTAACPTCGGTGFAEYEC